MVWDLDLDMLSAPLFLLSFEPESRDSSESPF